MTLKKVFQRREERTQNTSDHILPPISIKSQGQTDGKQCTPTYNVASRLLWPEMYAPPP